jgi:lipopolysaccharide export system permease protein
LIFFFIGAPLGAIIRKGGLGMPAVVAVLMFIVYYIIDTMGVKMAREAVWEVWQGMWLSSGVLLPIGIFLTYKAATDSVLFNVDGWRLFFKKFKIRSKK